MGAAFGGAANDDDDPREVTTKVEALRPRDRGEAGRVALGVAVPLVLLALVYALWWVSNELLYVGPLDRAAFGWSVVIPLWIALRSSRLSCGDPSPYVPRTCRRSSSAGR